MEFLSKVKDIWENTMDLFNEDIPFPTNISYDDMQTSGLAAYKRSGKDKGKLILSSSLQYVSDDDLKSIICHEACHAIETKRNEGRTDKAYLYELERTKGHNQDWVDLKKECENTFNITITKKAGDIPLPKLEMSNQLKDFLEDNGYNLSDIMPYEGNFDEEGFLYDDIKKVVMMSKKAYTKEDWTDDELENLTYELDAVGEEYDDSIEDEFLQAFLKK